jgi:hypothetical protein
MYENVYLDSLLVRQLKHRGFICNALNCLNEENKMFSNCLSIYLIFCSSSVALCLIVLMKKIKSLQIVCFFIFLLIFYYFLFTLSYIYIYIYI